ncbi:MAG: hypothetical protein QE271_04895 [Bacteriovoracaceae bacterium]|nr:hypothetical protein [Bacteriovoracaceae bacterium]
MGKLINVMVDLFYTAFSVTIIGGGILLIAGEVRLAALRKISHGSPKLWSFTEQMAGEKLRF